jgi:hypothetical protein
LYAPPPNGPGPGLPGKIGGKIESYWVLPFVKATVNADGSTDIAWLDEKGNLIRQSKAAYVGTGYIRLTGNINVMEGIKGDWKITLPPVPDEDEGSEMATADGRIFLVESTPKHGQLLLNVYVDGKLASKLGPFFRYKGRETELEGNCAALLVWKDQSKNTAQVVVIDGKGEISLRQDCDADVDSPDAAPDGKGVLIEDNRGNEHENTCMWYTVKGKTQTLKIEPNHRVVGWLPHTHRSLLSTSVGYDNRYRLIDWDTGETLWEIPCPGNGRDLAVGITPDLVLFSQAELFDGHGSWMGESLSLEIDKPEWIRVLYAVDAKTGKTVASWRPDPDRRLERGRGEFFCWSGGKFYFVADNEFTELNLEDITAKRHGWK